MDKICYATFKECFSCRAMFGQFWNEALNTFAPHPTAYTSEGEAVEVAQEDAALPAHYPWRVVAV